MKKFKPYFHYLHSQRSTLLLALLFGAISAASNGLGLPVIADKIFPMIFEPEKNPLPQWVVYFFSNIFHVNNISFVFLLVICFSFPTIFLIRGVSGFFNTYFLNHAGFKVLEFLRLDVYGKLQGLPIAFHEKQKRGDILSRVMSDTSQLQNVLVQVTCDLMIKPLTLISAAAYLTYKSVQNEQIFFMLLCLMSVPLCVFPIHYYGKKMLKKSKQVQKQAGDITALVQENLASQREIRAYGLEDFQVSQLASHIRVFFRSRMKEVKYRYIVPPMIEIVSAMGIGVALYYGKSSGMSLSTFFSLVIALYMCYEPIKHLGLIHNKIRQGEASLERLEEILQAEDTTPDPAQPVPMQAVRGTISFEKVDFSYNERGIVLDSISVEIPAGQVVALVGPSGAGKTTFASLLPRFYDPVKGAVLLDGVDIREMTKADLRKNIALVSQHPVLFRATFTENIRLGRQSASDEEVRQAAMMANAHEFIMQQPDGYGTMLGESGEGLSGGQRQRLAIARAFLKEAPILILDEATASLDAESESRIQAELSSLVKGKTTFVIAHRFSTIKIADRILVFEKGKIVGDGSHDSLYETNQLYRELYDKQDLELVAENERLN